MKSDPVRTARQPVLTRRNDHDLARLTSSGCPRAWEAIVLRHRPALARYCERLVPYGGLAEDVVQDTLVVAYDALRRGDRPRHPRAWLFGIAHHRAMSALRARPRTVTLDGTLDGVAHTDDPLESREEISEAVSCVRRLPMRQRQALVHRVLEDLPYPEIAASLRVSEDGARQLVARARRALRAECTGVVASAA
jgi:RNA polymerase sigma-70 factor (ECF subfamily)